MKKYITPTIEVVEIETNDILTASSSQAVYYDQLDGVDTDGSISAIFDVNYWLSKLGKK
jgi:hypothetical protein